MRKGENAGYHVDSYRVRNDYEMIFFFFNQGVKRPPDPEYITNQQLRHMCDNVLQLLTNTVEGMESVSNRHYYILLLIVGHGICK